MTIQEMKDKKKEKGYTYAQIANLSGVPLEDFFRGDGESKIRYASGFGAFF